MKLKSTSSHFYKKIFLIFFMGTLGNSMNLRAMEVDYSLSLKGNDSGQDYEFSYKLPISQNNFAQITGFMRSTRKKNLLSLFEKGAQETELKSLIASRDGQRPTLIFWQKEEDHSQDLNVIRRYEPDKSNGTLHFLQHRKKEAVLEEIFDSSGDFYVDLSTPREYEEKERFKFSLLSSDEEAYISQKDEILTSQLMTWEDLTFHGFFSGTLLSYGLYLFSPFQSSPSDSDSGQSVGLLDAFFNPLMFGKSPLSGSHNHYPQLVSSQENSLRMEKKASPMDDPFMFWSFLAACSAYGSFLTKDIGTDLLIRLEKHQNQKNRD